MGRPKKVQPRETPATYALGPTDFDEVATFNQLFANMVERSRHRSIAELLDYILQEGGVGMSNKDLMERINKLGMRADLHTPSPSESHKPTE